MSERKIIRISPDSEAFIRDYAEAKGLQFVDAADTVIDIAKRRLDALAKYGRGKKPKAPGKPRAKKSIKAKKAARAAKKAAAAA